MVYLKNFIESFMHESSQGWRYDRRGHYGADQKGAELKGPQFEVELRAVPAAAETGEVLKADGQLSDDEDAALKRTIAALVLNLRGIDPEIRESGLDMLCRLALRR